MTLQSSSILEQSRRVEVGVFEVGMAVSLSLSSIKFLFFSFCVIVLVGLVRASRFDELFQPSWALDHFVYEGEELKLKLDNYSG